MPENKTTPIRLEYATGGFPADQHSNLREPHWNWGMGPDDIIVVHDATHSYPWPVGIVRLFNRLVVNADGDVRLRAACLGGVFVLPNYRAEGIGRFLVYAAARLATFAPGYDVAIVHSSERHLYTEAGFQPIGGGMLGLHLHSRFRHFDTVKSGWSTIPADKF